MTRDRHRPMELFDLPRDYSVRGLKIDGRSPPAARFSRRCGSDHVWSEATATAAEQTLSRFWNEDISSSSSSSVRKGLWNVAVGNETEGSGRTGVGADCVDSSQVNEDRTRDSPVSSYLSARLDESGGGVYDERLDGRRGDAFSHHGRFPESSSLFHPMLPYLYQSGLYLGAAAHSLPFHLILQRQYSSTLSSSSSSSGCPGNISPGVESRSASIRSGSLIFSGPLEFGNWLQASYAAAAAAAAAAASAFGLRSDADRVFAAGSGTGHRSSRLGSIFPPIDAASHQRFAPYHLPLADDSGDPVAKRTGLLEEALLPPIPPPPPQSSQHHLLGQTSSVSPVSPTTFGSSGGRRRRTALSTTSEVGCSSPGCSSSSSKAVKMTSSSSSSAERPPSCGAATTAQQNSNELKNMERMLNDLRHNRSAVDDLSKVADSY